MKTFAEKLTSKNGLSSPLDIFRALSRAADGSALYRQLSTAARGKSLANTGESGGLNFDSFAKKVPKCWHCCQEIHPLDDGHPARCARISEYAQQQT